MERYTEIYQMWLLDLNAAQIAFDKNPTKKTATVLSNIKNKPWRDEEKFTPEFLKERDKATIAKFREIVRW